MLHFLSTQSRFFIVTLFFLLHHRLASLREKNPSSSRMAWLWARLVPAPALGMHESVENCTCISMFEYASNSLKNLHSRSWLDVESGLKGQISKRVRQLPVLARKAYPMWKWRLLGHNLVEWPKMWKLWTHVGSISCETRKAGWMESIITMRNCGSWAWDFHLGYKFISLIIIMVLRRDPSIFGLHFPPWCFILYCFQLDWI